MERGRQIRRNAALEAICRLPLRSVHHVIGGVFPGGKLEDAEAPLPQRLAFPCRGIANGKCPVRACVHAVGKLALRPPQRTQLFDQMGIQPMCRSGHTPAGRSMPSPLPSVRTVSQNFSSGRPFPTLQAREQVQHPVHRCRFTRIVFSSMSLPYSSTLRTSHAQSQIVSQAPAMPPMPPVPNPGWKPPIARTQLSQCLDTSLRV